MGIDVAITEWAFFLGRQAQTLVVFSAQYLPYLLGAAVLIWVLWRKDGKTLLQLVAAAILSRLVFTEAIRFLWDRSRPFIELGFTPLLEHAPSGSFPSGHAAFFFALSAVVFAKDKKTGTVFLLLSSFIVIARVFAGIHWFSDVLAGVVVGVISAWFVLKAPQGFKR